ncbi:flavin reductase family protein [Litoreibacter arenae]|uniref:Nitrilotriacetate monooxygenase component B n=1 Tax=Litoreibacter arenae DSM 19593 TaxID=1123360 RepID=S9QJL6_9RHOB|nr:flavin reductase family protein [Litoreibacter arenae]EPX81611.1 Nitrilotriacetate monooxygenase component B [Litoreibacter arenae DSM 19593]
MSVHDRTTTNLFVPDEDNTRLLRDAFGRFATGVTIVTAATENGVAAITANSFSSVSLSPPLVLWSPDKTSRRFSYFEAATHYAVHVLSTDQDDLCWAVAKDVYALRDRDLRRNAEGVPVLEGCLARFECTKTAVYEGGDHVIMLGQVNRAAMREEGDPLAFYKGQMGRFTAQ